MDFHQHEDAKALLLKFRPSFVRFYDPPLDVDKDEDKISVIQAFDEEARQCGLMFDIRNKYIDTVPGAECYISIVDSWTCDTDLIESHGGEYAVYEECLRRNITWEELVNERKHTEEVLQEIRKRGGFSNYVL